MEKAQQLMKRSDSLAKDYLLYSVYTGFQRADGDGWETNVRRSKRQWSKLFFSGVNNILFGDVSLPIIENVTRQAGKGDSIDHILDKTLGSIDSGLAGYPVKERISALAQLGALRVNKGRMKDAIVLYEKALKESNGIGKVNADLYFMLGLLHHKVGERMQADKFVDSAILMGRHTGNWQVTAEALRLQGKIKGVTTELIDSIMYYHRKAEKVMMNAQIGSIMAQQALTDKNERIANLAEQDALRVQNLKQRRWQIIFLSLLVVALITIAYLLYRKSRLRKRMLVSREAELLQQLLRSQMEGHFMYNSLSNLQALIRSNEQTVALSYLSQFSRLLQLNQFNSREPYVSLLDEVVALEAYLALQMVHWDNRFQYTLSTYDNFHHERLLIPPMLIQPFVENAVVHGVSQLESGGMVHISIIKEQHTILCRIEDNGPGLGRAPSRLKPSISTVITNERLQVLGKRTGVKGSLEVMSAATPGKTGTVVILRIPFRPAGGVASHHSKEGSYAATGEA
ncbi:histidine kinase [Chitinophaga pollutisoli]|uniref:Histidine kinase n=1 Tax=Chitinophaga pollutisoli TaxID=3133966 RepID=A0ABZ2YSR4_9BACT